MPKEEWGVKRICPTTGKRFYDLNKNPIVSPYTGEVVELDSSKTRLIAADAEDAANKSTESQDIDTDDVVLDDDVEVDLGGRLSLARAFANSPELLLLDEAFVSLDPQIYGEMIRLFKSLRSETKVATLMITHDLAEAHDLAEHVYTLAGSPAQLSKI